jgi:hypothetical protein
MDDLVTFAQLYLVCLAHLRAEGTRDASGIGMRMARAAVWRLEGFSELEIAGRLNESLRTIQRDRARLRTVTIPEHLGDELRELAA